MENAQDSLSDSALVQKVKRGDRRAFAKLYERHKDPLYAYCLQLLKNEEEAKDAVQETFLRMQQGLESLRDGLAIRVWLLSIARNYIFNSKRNRFVLYGDDTEVPSEEENPFDLIAGKESMENVRSSIERLKPALREVMVLRAFEGLSYREIADLTGVSEELVKIRLYRARKAVISHLHYLGK